MCIPSIVSPELPDQLSGSYPGGQAGELGEGGASFHSFTGNERFVPLEAEPGWFERLL